MNNDQLIQVNRSAAMEIEQYVMAYSVEQDILRAILPNGFASLRSVLRINAENAAHIPCEQVLGAYAVKFVR